MTVENKNANKNMLRYIYMLKIDNRGVESRFYGRTTIFYAGQTSNIKHRINQHINGINSKFLSKFFPNSRKVPIYIEYVYGTEYDAMRRENIIKRKSKFDKEMLVKSEKNVLIKYIPLKALILKKYNMEDEQTCVNLR